MLFSLLKHYSNLYITDSAVKVPWSLYGFTNIISHGAENFFLGMWDVIFLMAIEGISLLSRIYVLLHK